MILYSTVAQKSPTSDRTLWLVKAAKRRFDGLRARCVRPLYDAGMTTAEYAVGTIAAVAFAVVLYKIVTSSQVGDALRNIIVSALQSI